MYDVNCGENICIRNHQAKSVHVKTIEIKQLYGVMEQKKSEANE